MLDYIASLRSDSARFTDLIQLTDPTIPVPSCPGWSASDLFWHLTEVQHFWATVVDGLLADPKSIPELSRPNDAALADVFATQSARLIQALQRRNPADECWSWHGTGHNVGWVRRRQAHEALIHRIDAELAAGNVPSVDETLASDGVDEILTTYLDAGDIPNWASFVPDGTSARIAVDGGVSWTLVLGRLRGTSPASGNTYDDPALRLEDVAEPATVISGRAPDLDLWLWGRGPSDPLQVRGDETVVARVRSAAAAGTR